MSDAIDSVAALERVAGGQPLSALLKSIDVFDAHCEALLARSSLAILTWCDPDGGQHAVALGGAPGFARVEGPRVLTVPAPELGAPQGDVGAALLFFVPGLGETLRVNGRATAAGGALRIELQEAFGHCAKALIRSALWERVRGSVAPPAASPAPAEGAAAPGPLSEPGVAAFLARSPFLAIGSASEQGACDVSPRGDPPGFARILDGETLALPERRGNRRTDTLRNLLGRPAAALVALAPGDPRTLELAGRASLTREPALLESMAVGGKAPKVALLVRVERARLAESPALAAGGLWDASRFHDLSGLPPMARVFADHVRQNRRRGVAAAAIRALASERLLAPALKRDYEKGLY